MKGYYDISGDGGSGIVAQVTARQDRIRARLSRIRHVVAIASGKGGVGKSTLTVGLARALGRAGRSVAILDADLNGPSQARLAGLTGTTLVPGTEGLVPARSDDGLQIVSMGSIVPESQAVDFDTVAPGDSYTWRATREFSALADLVGGVDWGRADFLLVDLPPGAERTVQYAEFFGDAAAFVLVTAPSDLSRGVVSRSLAALRATPARVLGYVENMKGYVCPDCRSVKPLFPEDGEVVLDAPRLGEVPFDPELARSCDRGQEPADSEGASGTALGRVAREVTRRLEEDREVSLRSV